MPAGVAPPPVPDDHDPQVKPSTAAVDSDLDAEGEEETDLYQMDQQLQDAVHRAYSGETDEEDRGGSGDEQDAEGEPDTEMNGSGENDETEPVGAVKLPDDAPSVGEDDDIDADADVNGDPAFENDSNSDREASASSSPESDDEWEAESNAREDAEVDNNTVRGNCL